MLPASKHELVMVYVHGSRDGLHAASFVQSSSVDGNLTYSASGVRLSSGLVLVPLSLLWTFLDNSSKQHVQAALSCGARSSPLPSWSSNDLQTRPGTHVEVVSGEPSHPLQAQSACLSTCPCHLLGGFAVPEAAHALQDLLHSVQGSHQGWRFGWCLAGSIPPSSLPKFSQQGKLNMIQELPPPASIGACFAILEPCHGSVDHDPQKYIHDEGVAHYPQRHNQSRSNGSKNDGCNGSSSSSSSSRSSSHGAAAGALCNAGTCPSIHAPAQAPVVEPFAAQPVWVQGAAFGCLAPHHFHNCIVKGVVSACLPTSPPNKPAAFLLDAAVLPGMEGGLVLGEGGSSNFQPSHCLSGTGSKRLPMEGGGGGNNHQSHLYHTQQQQQSEWVSELPLPDGQDAQGQALGSCAAPLGILTLPLSRSQDNVQVPIAISWSHIQASLQTHLTEGTAHFGSLSRGSESTVSVPANAATISWQHQCPTSRLGDREGNLCSSRKVYNPEQHLQQHQHQQEQQHCQHQQQQHHHYYHHNQQQHHHRQLAACAAAGQCGSQCQLQINSPPQFGAQGCASAQSPAEAPSRLGTAHDASNSCRDYTRQQHRKPQAQNASIIHRDNTKQATHPAATNSQIHTGNAFRSNQLQNAHSNQLMGACCRQPDSAASLQRALAGVVLICTRNSWATGVLISEGGLILTNAHLLVPDKLPVHRPSLPSAAPSSSPPSSSSLAAKAAAAAVAADRYPSCSVRISARSSGSEQGHHPRQRWLLVRVLYVFRNHLDLAILQLDVAEMQWERLRLQPLHLQEASSAFRCREDVLVLGHGLLGPSTGLGAAATHGNIAKVIHADGRPSMLLTTASVYSGASGGALVSRQGKLLGLVTSNARHVSGATLPRLNFCIASEELQPIVRMMIAVEHQEEAARLQGATQGMQVTLALQDLDRYHESADRVWKLQDPFPASKL